MDIGHQTIPSGPLSKSAEDKSIMKGMLQGVLRQAEVCSILAQSGRCHAIRIAHAQHHEMLQYLISVCVYSRCLTVFNARNSVRQKPSEKPSVTLSIFFLKLHLKISLPLIAILLFSAFYIS